MAFVGKMERQTRITKKREQRHSREINSRKDQFVSAYIRCKYSNVYSEAEEFHDLLKALYPNKHDLRKTVEYASWKNQISNTKSPQIQPQLQEPPTQCTSTGSKNMDNMELKIELINCKPKTTTTQETIEVIQTGISPSIPEQISTLQENIDDVNSATAEIMEQDIWPSLDEKISTELLQHIIADLNAEPYLKDMLSDFEILGSDIEIDEQYTLEDELALCKKYIVR